MKIGESKQFRELCADVIDFYDIWDETADVAPTTERTCVMGTNREETTCLMIFKGNKEDCFAVRKFLERRDKKK